MSSQVLDAVLAPVACSMSCKMQEKQKSITYYMFTVLQYFRMLVLKPVATGLILPYLRLKFEE